MSMPGSVSAKEYLSTGENHVNNFKPKAPKIIHVNETETSSTMSYVAAAFSIQRRVAHVPWSTHGSGRDGPIDNSGIALLSIDLDRQIKTN